MLDECDVEDYLPDNYMNYTPNHAWQANICNFTSSHILYRKYNGSWEISNDDQGSTSKKSGSYFEQIEA